MARKKTTGKKSGRSKSKAAMQEKIAPARIQEAIVPFEPVAVPVEVRPMPIQSVEQPSKVETPASDQPARQGARPR